MAQHLMKFFSFLTPANTDVFREIDALILKDHFDFVIGEAIYQQVILGVTENYLLLMHTHQGQQISYYCPFNFNVKFEVIRKQWPDEKSPGISIGIRLDQSNPNETLEFYHSYSHVVEKWGEVLQRKLNQRNFHKLFKAKKKIGKGAFATVYLAERLLDKKIVAVKAFSKEKQFSGDKGKESLENEIKIMRSVSHENITKLLEVYETQNSIYVILDILQGKQLNDEIKSGRKFTIEEAIQILKQLLMALSHLSTKRIIHRDLKPENIMFKLKNSLDVCICDFGLATYADQEKYLFVRCGTPGFVAPQIINLKDMNAKSEPISDIFSVGVIAHILFLGHSIFSGKKYNEVLAQNRACQFDFSKSKYQELPNCALSLLVLLLEKDPKKRISAGEALNLPIFNEQIDCNYRKMPFQCIENQYSTKKTQKVQYDSCKESQGSEMIDENNASNMVSFNIGHSIKKKMPYLIQNNLSIIQNPQQSGFYHN